LPASLPKKEFSLPDALLKPAWSPKKELELPAIVDCPALLPKNELPKPVVLLFPAEVPKNELALPVVLARPLLLPKNALLLPVLFSPVPAPTNVLNVPAVLNTRLPPRLYCVAALRMFAVPLPLMLKLLPVCGEFVF